MQSKTTPNLWNRIVRAYVTLSFNKPWLPLLILALITLGTTVLSSKLRIDTDLRVLLPKGTPSVVALQEAEQRMGSTDFYTIAFQDTSAEAVGRFQKDVADSLATWQEVTWTQFDQDRSFFERHALLYLPTSELKDLYERINSMVGKSFSKANPLVENFLEDSVAVSLQGWPNEEVLRRQGLPKDLVDALLTKIQSKNKTKSIITNENEPTRPDSLKSRLMGWHEGKKVWVGVVMAQLKKPSTDAIFAKGIFNRGTHLITSMRPESYSPNMDAAVVGAYRNFSEIDQISSDIILAGTISFVLMIILLWFFVKKIVNLILINVPLFVAISWTTGATFLIYHRLTLLTAFILALILGLGIEYTVHLYSRWAEENKKGSSPLEAMIQAVSSTGRSLLAGAATNIFAMLSLQLGHFKGFKEYGMVITMGITLALLSTWLVIPPLFFLFAQLSTWIKSKTKARLPLKMVDWFLPSGSKVEGGLLFPSLFWLRPKILFSVAIFCLVFTIAISFAPQVHFENDFANLRGKSTSSGISYGRAVGVGRNTSPSLILGKSETQMRSVHDSLAVKTGNPADSMMKSFATIQSFVPPEKEQKARLEILSQIKALLASRALTHVDSSTQADLNLIRKYLDPTVFGFDSLPKWSQRFMIEADGSHGKFGYLYGELQESDALESAKFQKLFGTVPSAEGPVAVASTGFIYADVVRMVKSDGVRLAVITFLLLIVITWLDMRSWRGVVISCGFVLLSSYWTYKIMGLFHLKLGMYNLVVLPTILSVSVDSVIHLYHRRMELGAGKLMELYRTTGSAVLTGTLNNAFGFVGLCFVSHKGMQTIGQLATLGIGTGLVIMFTLLPWVLEVLCPKIAVHRN